MNKPDIVILNKINIVGYEYKTNLNDYKYFKDIPEFYDDFGKK